MKRAALRRDILIVVGIYAAWMLLGACLFFVDNIINGGEKTLLTPGGHLHQYQYFELYSALTPVALLLPAVWIGFGLQRRAGFANNLRMFWPGLVESVQRSIEYLRRVDGDIDEYERTLTALRSRVDDAGALFGRRVPADPPAGRSPYDGIAHIHQVFQNLGYHDIMPEDDSRLAHDAIIKTWQVVKAQVLQEFDRADLD